MSLKWNTNENPVGSQKLNKMTIRHLTTTERNALTSSDVDIGDIIFDRTENKHYRVDTVSPSVTFKALGGSNLSFDAPNAPNYKGSVIHFFNSLGMSAVGGNAIFSINTADADEMRNHSAKADNSMGTGTEAGGEVDSMSIYHTKNDINDSFTKATFEFRSKLGLRAASFKNFMGLNDKQNPMNTATTRKICVFESNGNFFLRTSDGTTESDMDTGTLGDTSLHKWKFVWQSGSVQILLDGVIKGTKTSNIPTTALTPAHSFRNDTGAGQTPNAVWDYASFILE